MQETWEKGATKHRQEYHIRCK